MNNVVFTDPMSGRAASVDQAGSVATRVKAVEGDVATKNTALELTANTGDVVTDVSAEIVPETSGRQALVVVNTGLKRIYLRFGDAATTSDFPLEPGQSFSFHPVGESVLNACCDADQTSTAHAVEWKVPS